MSGDQTAPRATDIPAWVAVDAPALATLAIVPSIFEAVISRIGPVRISPGTREAALADGVSMVAVSRLKVEDPRIASDRERELYRRIRWRWPQDPVNADRGAASTLLLATGQASLLIADESVTQSAAQSVHVLAFGSVDLLIAAARRRWLEPVAAIAGFTQWRAERGLLLGPGYMSGPEFRAALKRRGAAIETA